MKKIKTASNIRFRRYTYRRYDAEKRLAEMGVVDLDTVRQALKQAPEIPLKRVA